MHYPFCYREICLIRQTIGILHFLSDGHFDIEVEVHVPGFLRLSEGAQAVGEPEKRVCKL